jgi:hypothetical protein
MADTTISRRTGDPKRTASRLVLHNVALTDRPSNPEALVFVARSISQTPEVKVPDPIMSDEAVARQISEAVATARAEFESTQRAKDERIAALETDKAARDEDISRSQCNDTASVFRNIGADGVKLGDLIFRTRKAAKASGDAALETDLITILRAADARAKAGGTVALTENRGSGSDGESVERALDKFSPVTRAAIQKHFKDGSTLTSAMRAASKEAIADGKDPIYTEISTALNGKG